MTTTLPAPLIKDTSDSSKTDSLSKCPKKDAKKNIRHCYYHLAGGIALVCAFTGFVIYHEVSSNSLMARIHHDFILCTRLEPEESIQNKNINELIPLKARQAKPEMVKFSLAEAVDPAASFSGNTQLNTVINWAQNHRNSLMMLQITPGNQAINIIKTLTANHLMNRIVVSADNIETAKTIFNTNPNTVVAVPVKSVQDLQRYRSLAHQYSLAFYIPNNASQKLFRMAHKEATAIITDFPRETPNTNKLDNTYLSARWINILVADPDISLPDTVLKG